MMYRSVLFLGMTRKRIPAVPRPRYSPVSATGTFFFRQFFRSVPEELLEAARLDGATPLRFFIDILVPLSNTMIAAILIIMFVVGWNQYLWPLLVTNDPNMRTV